MRIELDVQPAALIKRLHKGERRLAYAAVNAGNKTAKRVQQAERDRVRKGFTIRRPTFMMRQTKPYSLRRLSVSSATMTPPSVLRNPSEPTALGFSTSMLVPSGVI